MPPKQKDKSYGGAAVAAGGGVLATSTPWVGRIDRAVAGHRRAKIDRKIEDVRTNMPKSAGERRGLPQTSQMRQRQPATSKKQLKLRQTTAPSPEKTQPLRLQRKAAYRTMHELSEARKVIKPNISIRSLRANIAAGAVGVPLSYAGARHQLKQNHKVSKKDDDKRKLNAGYAGAVGGAAAYQGAGYAAIPIEQKHAKAIKANPAHNADLEAHRKKYIGPTTHKNDPGYRAFFRNYPKHLPGGKMRRTLSWTHTGKTGTALTLGAAGATAGAAVAAAGHKKKPVSKRMSAFGVEH